MSRKPPAKTLRTACLTAMLCIACLWSHGPGAVADTPNSFSSQFLDVLNEACFTDSSRFRRDQPRTRSRVRVILANSRRGDLSQICAYDLTCGEVVFSGRIERSRRVNFTVCADSRGRGHVVLLDPFGTLIERSDLQSPATIRLGQ